MAAGPDEDGLFHTAFAKRAQRLVALEEPANRADEDAVHQMRVATTRLRALLHVYGRALTPTPQSQLTEELRWLASLLGSERDAEVRAARLGRLVAAAPEAVSAVQGKALVRAAEAERTGAHEILRRGLDSERYRALAALVEKFAEQPPFCAGARDRRWYRRKLDRAVGKVLERHAELPSVGDPRRDAALHRVRKVAKRARYGAEVLAEGGSTYATRAASHLHRLQEVLGEHHDAAELCRRFVASSAQGDEGGLLLGWLYHEEREAMAEAEREFAALWRRLTRAIRR